jgi:hypothetical protein
MAWICPEQGEVLIRELSGFTEVADGSETKNLEWQSGSKRSAPPRLEVLLGLFAGGV